MQPQSKSKVIRFFSKLDKTNRVRIFHETCIFCGKIRQTVKKNEQKLVQAERKNFEVNFKKCANWLDDEEIVRKISNNDFIAKEIRYNGFCRTEYQTRARKSPKGKEEEMNQEEPAETN